MATFTVTPDEVEQFERCPRRWAFGTKVGYGLGFYKEPHHPYEVLRRAMRAFIFYSSPDQTSFNAYGEARKILVDSLRDGDEDWNREIGIGLGVLQHFADFYPLPGWNIWKPGAFPDTPCDFISDRLIPNSITEWRGDFDAIAESDTDPNQVYLVRFVITTQHMPTQAWRWERFDPKMAFTLALAHEDNVAGVLFIYVRFKAPCVPETLKSGGLTRRANLDTTTAVYLRTLREQGLNPADYTSTLARLEEQGNKFFGTATWIPTKGLIETTRRRMREVAQSMWNGKQWVSHCNPYDPAWCATCPFTAACRVAQEGGTTEAIERELTMSSGARNDTAVFDWSL